MLTDQVNLGFTNDESIKQVFLWYLDQINQRFMRRVHHPMEPKNMTCFHIQNNTWWGRYLFVSGYGELAMFLRKLEAGKPLDSKVFHDSAKKLNDLSKLEERINIDSVRLKELNDSNSQVAENDQDDEIQLIAENVQHNASS